MTRIRLTDWSAASRLLALGGLALLVAASLAVAGCGGGGAGDASRLTLVSYSTPREAYEQIIPAFARTPAGGGIELDQSYGASGEQRRAVENGLDADVVAFSLEPDMTSLVESELVDPGWNTNASRGMVTDSVVVLAVRRGNPKGIRDWDDLVREGVTVVTPGIFTSGGAKWNLAAVYGARLARGESEAEALAFVQRVLDNTPVQPPSAREALQAFTSGQGDVLISYENEAITARQNGEELDYVIPDDTILIENPVAATTTSGNPAAAQAFVDYLLTEPAQTIFAEKGYRPVVRAVADAVKDRYPEPPGLFTIGKLGGWERADAELFDEDGGTIARIVEGEGVPTS